MRVCISSEGRFERTADGRVWSRSQFPYLFWTRYLGVFDEVRVIARLGDVTTEPDSTWRRSDGEGVTFHPVPYYVGPVQYARRAFSIYANLRNAVRPADAVIMRVPSVIARPLEQHLPSSRPCGLEVLSDPQQVFAPGSIEHPLRAFFRWKSTRHLALQCRRACAVAYVTGFLQTKYPPGKNAFATTYTMADLDDSAFVANSRSFAPSTNPVRIVGVGTLEVMYKGFDVLIDAVSSCIGAGLKLQLTIVGEGRRRAELERLVQLRGIEQQVRFTGRLPTGDAVWKELDSSDLFVLSSKTEGLPSAMIEAMARGLPSIGSDVGGIPELLDPDELVPPGDAPALARKIAEVVNDPARMTRMSARNLVKAHEHHASVVNPRRHQFYSYLRDATLDWNHGVVTNCSSSRHTAPRETVESADRLD